MFEQKITSAKFKLKCQLAHYDIIYQKGPITIQPHQVEIGRRRYTTRSRNRHRCASFLMNSLCVFVARFDIFLACVHSWKRQGARGKNRHQRDGQDTIELLAHI